MFSPASPELSRNLLVAGTTLQCHVLNTALGGELASGSLLSPRGPCSSLEEPSSKSPQEWDTSQHRPHKGLSHPRPHSSGWAQILPSAARSSQGKMSPKPVSEENSYHCQLKSLRKNTLRSWWFFKCNQMVVYKGTCGHMRHKMKWYFLNEFPGNQGYLDIAPRWMLLLLQECAWLNRQGPGYVPGSASSSITLNSCDPGRTREPPSWRYVYNLCPVHLIGLHMMIK